MIIYESMARSVDGKIVGRVRLKDGRLEATITGLDCGLPGDDVAIARDDGEGFAFEFEALAVTSDVPVRWRLIRTK